MREFELDKRQRGIVKLCREVSDPGKAKLDVVMQSANFAGLTTALRNEERAAEVTTKTPALCLVETAKCGIYMGIQNAARRYDTAAHGYLEGMKNIIHVLSKTGCGGRAVCIAFDHAGAVPVERLESTYRAADDVAYRLKISVRLIVVITKVQAWDYTLRTYTGQFPIANELLKPRWRTFEYGAKAFQFVKPALTFQPVMAETPLLDSEAENKFKIA